MTAGSAHTPLPESGRTDKSKGRKANSRRKPSDRKIRHYRNGLMAERIAVFILRLKGYSILARRHGGPYGEIDIIARKGNSLIAVEVKSRPSIGEAATAISPVQKERIVRALAAFAAQRRSLSGLALRFDAILVAPWSMPRHLVDAWGLDNSISHRHVGL